MRSLRFYILVLLSRFFPQHVKRVEKKPDPYESDPLEDLDIIVQDYSTSYPKLRHMSHMSSITPSEWDDLYQEFQFVWPSSPEFEPCTMREYSVRFQQGERTKILEVLMRSVLEGVHCDKETKDKGSISPEGS